MDKIELTNKIFAGMIAVLIGLITTIVTYIGLGYICEPFKKWIEQQILGGTN